MPGTVRIALPTCSPLVFRVKETGGVGTVVRASDLANYLLHLRK